MGLTDFVKDGLNSVFSSIFSPRKQAPQKRKREEKQADAARGRGKPVPRRDAVVQADAAAQSSAQQLQEPVQARAPERGFEQPAATPLAAHLAAPFYVAPQSIDRLDVLIPVGASLGARGYAGSRQVWSRLNQGTPYRDGFHEAPPLAPTPAIMDRTPLQQVKVVMDISEYQALIAQRRPAYFNNSQATPPPTQARSRALDGNTPITGADGSRLEASFTRAAGPVTPSEADDDSGGSAAPAAAPAAAASAAALRSSPPAETSDRVAVRSEEARVQAAAAQRSADEARRAAASCVSKAMQKSAKLIDMEAKIEATMQEVRALKLKREQLAEERREAEAPARAAEEDTALRPLTEEQERILARVFDENADPGEKLVIHDFKAFGYIEITRKIMACMRAGQWLNDEVINFYLGLLQEREMANGRPKAPRVHFHNTFFYNKLFTDAGEYQYKSVQRWTTEKRLGYCILDCELILIPVHQDIHWVLAAIDLVNKTVTYYDSLHGQDHTCLENLAQYISDEAKAKRQQVLDTSSWPRRFPRTIPRQENGCDCGVFTVKFGDYLARGRGLEFSQANMPYFRKRMVAEIVQDKSPY